MPKKQTNRHRPLPKEEKAARMKKIYKEDLVNLVSEGSDREEPERALQQTNNHLLDKQQNDSPNAVSPPQTSSHPFSECCPVCLDQSFEGGKYMLDCAHSFCSDCIQYWQAVSDLCPVCHKKTKSILSLYGGESRVRKLNYLPSVSACVKCGSNCNYHLMYFCDQCNHNCVHTYCDPSLREEEDASEKWVCESCIYSNYHQNRYNEESISEEVQEILCRREEDPDDSFVVADDIIDICSESYGEESIPTIKRPRKATSKEGKPRRNKRKG